MSQKVSFRRWQTKSGAIRRWKTTQTHRIPASGKFSLPNYLRAMPAAPKNQNSAPARRRVIEPGDIAGAYIEVLRLLDPYFHYKYATIPWLYYLSGAKTEYSVFRKFLSYMRHNNYIGCPEEQLASPNVDRKTLIYQLQERGLDELIARGIVSKRSGIEPSKSDRNHAFAYHRSNSYKHEIIVDLGYHLPLRYVIGKDPALRLVDFSALVQHPNVPLATRQSRDTLLVQLSSAQLRFDGTPHILVRTRPDGTPLTIGIPGIQVDRTGSHAQIEKHILHALEFIEARHSERHWGFDNCLVPFLFTSEVKKHRAMQFLRAERGACPFLLFQTIPDYALLRHYPRPEHYAPDYHYKDTEPHHPGNIRIFTNPWQRVGYPDFFLPTFNDTGTP